MSERVTVTVQRSTLTLRLGAIPAATLGPDLTAIEALTGTGIVRRTVNSPETWSAGTTVSIAEGGTGATTAAAAVTALGLDPHIDAALFGALARR